MNRSALTRRELLWLTSGLEECTFSVLQGAGQLSAAEIVIKLQNLFDESIEIFKAILSKECVEYGRGLRKIWSFLLRYAQGLGKTNEKRYGAENYRKLQSTLKDFG